MERNSDSLYLSLITVAEVEDGIARSRRTGAPAKAKRLTDWLEAVLHLPDEPGGLDLPIAPSRRNTLANQA